MSEGKMAMSDTLNKRRILIIEADPVASRLMANELQDGYALDFAADSEHALLRLQEQPSSRYALSIVGLRLPARIGAPASTAEGLKIVDFLRQSKTSIPITFVIVDNLVDRTREQIEESGIVKRVFEKPFSFKELHECINSELGETAEAVLLRKIHGVLPAGLRKQYDDLNDKLHEETITPAEHAELLTLIDRIELADAERMRSLITLAQLRQISVETLMEQLGIQRTTYV